MLDGVTYVEPKYNPIIHEGLESATVVVTNAGPSDVEIGIWGEYLASDPNKPLARLRLRAGNTRSVNGRLIRASIGFNRDGRAQQGHAPQVTEFAAIGWRIVR